MKSRRLHTVEFVAIVAMLFAMIAYSIDAMLPALQIIGNELSPDDANRGQLVVTSFVFGMGIGTLFVGALSDAYGRKPVLLIGIVVYVLATWLAWQAESLEALLFARFLQGICVAAPRIVGMAVIRDIYSGHKMARIMSFAMMVFSIVPAMAPMIGSIILDHYDWRTIFVSFAVFATFAATWFGVRQPETLPVEARVPFQISELRRAFAETMRNKMFVLTTLVQALILGMLMSVISSTQQIYDITFDEGARFPLWFAATALIAASASALNAALVGRFGMRALISAALVVELIISLVMAVALVSNVWPLESYLVAYFLWSTSIFFMLGFSLGNLNALAMEPMGHIAGMAASIAGSVSTVISVLIAVPVGLAFNGTPLPLAIGSVLCCAAGCLVMRAVARLERVAVSH
ncbi:MAG: multidrug effflux MFS transporter [Hyphomicrobiales bacterium]|nr:multidrug effflux MFS transporter [Hyphomicrobiales bacterium]